MSIMFFLCKKKEIKLKRIGIKNSEWFESYLSNRKQNSAIRKCCAFLYILVCKLRETARQYSRTLFFLVYVNDVSSSIDPDCKLILYANDKNPYFISEKLCTVDNKLSFILKKPNSFCL